MKTVKAMYVLLFLAGLGTGLTVGITINLNTDDRAVEAMERTADALERDQAERAEAKERAMQRTKEMWRGTGYDER